MTHPLVGLAPLFILACIVGGIVLAAVAINARGRRP